MIMAQSVDSNSILLVEANNVSLIQPDHIILLYKSSVLMMDQVSLLVKKEMIAAQLSNTNLLRVAHCSLLTSSNNLCMSTDISGVQL